MQIETIIIKGSINLCNMDLTLIGEAIVYKVNYGPWTLARIDTIALMADEVLTLDPDEFNAITSEFGRIDKKNYLSLFDRETIDEVIDAKLA